jgi:hypothetical protein
MVFYQSGKMPGTHIIKNVKLIDLEAGDEPGGDEPGPGPVEEPVYSVIGTLVGNWDVDTDMELVNGLYTVTFDNIAAGSYEFKLRQDHDWTINWGVGGAQDGPNFVAELPEGSSMTITFDPATGDIQTYVVGGALPPVGPAIVAEIDWTTAGAYYDGVWYSDGATVSVTGDGLIIESNPAADANYWEPQVPMIAHIPSVTEGGQYMVKFTLNAPAAGEIRLDFCSWDGTGATSAYVINVEAGEKEYEIEFPDYPTECTDAMVFYQSGKMPGTHIIKNVQVIDLEADAIQAVKKTVKADDAIYNLAGQKVGASYKGFVIKNGKKYIQK